MNDGARAETSRNRFAVSSVDIAVAGGVMIVVAGGVWAELAAWSESHIGFAGVFPVGAFLIGIAASAALVFRRHRPLLCTAVVLALVIAYHFAGYPGGAPTLALFVALYSLAAYAGAAWRIALALVLIPVWAVLPALPPNAQPWDSFATLGPAVGMVWLVVLGIAARRVRMLGQRSIEIAEAEAEARLREHLADERLAVAREIHDVLAHTVSVISVQSAAAIDAFEDDPVYAREAMVRVRALATEALPELRRTLAALRRGSPPPAGDSADEWLTPQPNLDGLLELARSARSPGLDVTLEDRVEHGLVGPVLGATIYRIVQESLTNVIRHSGATKAEVSLCSRDGFLRVQVTDNGTRGVRSVAVAGLGIEGMRERTRALGGTFSAEVAPSGGFAVTAEFPDVGRST